MYYFHLYVMLFWVVCSVIPSAEAASKNSTELKVFGLLSMGSCNPVFDNGGVLDFGKIRGSELDSEEPNDLGIKSINFTITCFNARVVGFTIMDNAAASAMTSGIGTIVGSNAFGLGKTVDGVNLGSYSIALDSVTLDGTDGTVISSSDRGATWTVATRGGIVDNTGATVWSAGVAGVDDTAAAATTFVYSIKVNPVLQGFDTLALTGDAALAGSSTFTLVYP
ncbi:DUF1120 domain-containing protein [Klebsiella aerogenes]